MHEVIVEVILLSLRSDGQLGTRHVEELLPAGLSPDAAAATLAGIDRGSAHTPGAVIHSTSWRPAAAGIVLTYVALPDPDHGAVTEPVDRDSAIVCSGDLLGPSPAVVPRSAVVAHACRHLAFLATTNAAVAAELKQQPALLDAVRTHAPDLAGQIIQS